MNIPPGGQPVYRLLTGSDDAAFCRRVSEALALGYTLHGSPAVTSSGKGSVFIVQALLWPGDFPAPREQQPADQLPRDEIPGLEPGRLAYGIDELAAALGVSRGLMHDFLASGQLRSVKVGKRRLIPADAVEEFLASAE